MLAPYDIINFMKDKLFYAKKDAFPSSKAAIEKILTEVYGIDCPVLSYTKNGKPFLESGEIHFSITHTNELLFLAFSDEEIGIDAEKISRELHHLPILKRLHPSVCEKIASRESFLKIWTAIESAIKYMGGTLAHDLKAFSFQNEQLYFQESPLPATVFTQVFNGHFISVCGKNFEKIPFVELL